MRVSMCVGVNDFGAELLAVLPLPQTIFGNGVDLLTRRLALHALSVYTLNMRL
jgi:hypothetical protein